MRIVDLEQIKLMKGAHSPDSKYCLLELSAYIAGESWSDHPSCVSPVCAAFGRSWNDALDDEERQMLKPYAIKLINTVGTDEQEQARAWMAIDWLARESAPAFLRLAGLITHAEILENLVPFTGAREAKSAQPNLAAARDAAWDAAGAAARDAAWDAAGAAAWDAARAVAGAAAGAAAWDAAGAAARTAARGAAVDAAGAAARTAARGAAVAAARAALAPTVKILQASALLLFDRMIAVTKE